MSDFRKLAHLEKQLGEERWKALIDSANTGKVKDLCDRLIVPNQMTIGGRTYEIVPLLYPREEMVSGSTLVARAREMNACLGKADADHILKHKGELPTIVSHLLFLFADCVNPEDSDYVGHIHKGYGDWQFLWGYLKGAASHNNYGLRRKS